MADKTTICKVKRRSVVEEERKSLIPYNNIEGIERIEKSNCKMCQSANRDEAEIRFEEQRMPNYNAIVTWLRNEKNEAITYSSVKNHMVYHFKIKERRESLNEYAEDIRKWTGIQNNTIYSIKKRIAILDREMMIIGAAGEDLPIIERRKNAETLKKLGDSILLYEGKLDEYQQNLKPVMIVIQQLKIIITDEMEQINNLETRKVLVNVLDRLQTSMGDMIVEQEK